MSSRFLNVQNTDFGGVTDIIPDPERADLITEMFYKASQGWSGRRLKDWLEEQGVTTSSGKPIPLSSVLAMLINPFYYGVFQYPEGPDAKWYKGAHKPLISKELFDQVQQTRGVYKGKWGSKQFAFRGLLKCGRCGADITAQEKFKQLKNGEFNRHVYYNCTRRVDPHCKEKYVNENDLCVLLQEFIEANHKKIRITDKLQAKIEKHYGVTKTLFEHYKIEEKLENPFIEYSRYALSNGTDNEMTAFAKGIRSRLTLKEGKLRLQT